MFSVFVWMTLRFLVSKVSFSSLRNCWIWSTHALNKLTIFTSLIRAAEYGLENEYSSLAHKGCTLQELWYNVLTRLPPVPFVLDEFTKEFIWKQLQYCASRSPSLHFFLLPQPRMLNIDEGAMPQFGKGGVRDVSLPYRPVSDGPQQLRGSCSTFDTRIEITQEIVHYKPALEDVQNK